MCRDLKDRIGRRINDPLARPLMLGTELVDDRGAGGGLVPQPAAPRTFRELVQQWNRKSLGISSKRFLQQHPADFPVSCRAILARRCRLSYPVRCGGADPGRKAGDHETRPAFSQSKPLQIGKPQPTDGAGDVAQRVRPGIAVLSCIWRGPAAESIQDDDRGAAGAVFHTETRRRRGPSPVRNSCGTSPLHRAISFRVMRCVASAPTMVATSPA